MTAARVDGRRLRSAASRRKIIAAMLELVEEGVPAPTAEATAERAGVSLRTVFRHFEDMNSLHAAMIAIVFDRLRPILEEPLRRSEWPDTLHEAIGRRAQFFETLAPYKVAIDVLRYRSRPVELIFRRMDKISRNLLTRAVPPWLRADRQRFELLVLLLSAESWQRLRLLQRLSASEARAAVTAGAVAIAGVEAPRPAAANASGRAELADGAAAP